MAETRKRILVAASAVWLAAAFGVCGTLGGGAAVASDPPSKRGTIDVLFSPEGGCQARIVEEIGRAKKRVLVQAYFFTSKPIAEALIEAQQRGVECEVIADASQEKMTYGRLPVLRRAGVKVLIDAEHKTANNKVILIDTHTIITGSYNYTKAAEEENAENVLIIKRHKDLFKKYLANYEKHQSHARPFRSSRKTV